MNFESIIRFVIYNMKVKKLLSIILTVSEFLGQCNVMRSASEEISERVTFLAPKLFISVLES